MSTRRDFLHLTAAATAVGALASSATAPALAEAAATGPGHPIPPTGDDRLRLVTFVPTAGKAPRLGAVRGDGRVVDLSQVAVPGLDTTRMVSLIEAGPKALDMVRRAAASGDGPQVETVRLLAPIPAPTRNVYAVGWNYLEHFKEGQATSLAKTEYPAHPVFFTKGVNTVNGPYDPIPYDAEVSTQIDWEAELAIIIGTGGSNIKEADALAHVFGYSVMIDISARDCRRAGQWIYSKGQDTFAPFGPVIVTADEIPDPHVLDLSLTVNGVQKQSSNTRHMLFNVNALIADISRGMTLEPGDIIATGTPDGVGAGRSPQEWLWPGDVVEAQVEKIGKTRHPVVKI